MEDIPLPAALKAADLARFAHRASQLDKHKPAIAYWCRYWMINQILGKSLHETNDECLEYTTALMDKLEQTKREHADDEAVMTDEGGQILCRAFAQDIFSLAEKAVDGNRVTRQTADKFLAAATFLDLLRIWDPNPGADVAAKALYSKWLATKIFKAIQEGRDPNDVNPRRKQAQEEEEEEAATASQGGGLPVLDPNDPEVRMLMGKSDGELNEAAPSTATTYPRTDRILSPMPKSVTVEDESDEMEAREPQKSGGRGMVSAAVSSIEPPSPQVSNPTFSSMTPMGNNKNNTAMIPSVPHDGVSPLAPPEPTPGSYFPPVTSAAPTTTDYYGTTQFVDLGSGRSPAVTAPTPNRISYQQQTPVTLSPPEQLSHTLPISSTNSFTSPSAAAALSPPPAPLQSAAPTPWPPSSSVAQHQQQRYQQQQQHIQRYTTSEKNMAEAQKHAKWAISALNFEDVPTAVKELQIALDRLLE